MFGRIRVVVWLPVEERAVRESAEAHDQRTQRQSAEAACSGSEKGTDRSMLQSTCITGNRPVNDKPNHHDPCRILCK